MLIAEDVTYPVLRLFIEGYLHGLGQSHQIGLIGKITDWFQKRVNQKEAVFFTNHIPHIYNHKSEEELKEILLQTLVSYFEENPEWQKK